MMIKPILLNRSSARAMLVRQNFSTPFSKTTLLLFMSFGLVACGDSDLTELHAEKIAAEVQRVEQLAAQKPPEEMPDLGAGAPAGPNSDGEPAPSAETAAAIAVADHELVFFDEFEGTQLDGTKWNSAMAWGADLTINDEMQYYVDTLTTPDSGFDPFQLDGEALVITADKTPANFNGNANGQEYVSGALTTLGKFDMTYGYVEARVDLPAGVGLWPSIWMLGTEFVDLKPQLFMMEFNGAKTDSVFHNYNYTDADGNLRSPRQHEVVVEGASDGWQTIGVRWTQGELLFFVNGYPTFQVQGDNVSSQAMYLIMNLAVGGLWVDDPDTSTPEPAEFKIDYIRVYQSK